jgi:hypothetical protein
MACALRHLRLCRHREKVVKRLANAPIRRLLSRGKTLPYTTFDHVFPWRAAWHTPPRLVAADASRYSCVWRRRCGRRPSHPAGLGPRDVSLASQTSAPGTGRAPENRQCPAVSNLYCSQMLWLPGGSRFPMAHGRGVARLQNPVAGHWGWVEVRTNQSPWLRTIFPPSLSPQPIPWRDLSQKLCGPQRAPGRA